MDDKWFKTQQKKAGVTAEEIAAKMGRDRSVVSRIYTGRQKMSLEWAQAFAEVLNVPIDEVLRHAGIVYDPLTRSDLVASEDGIQQVPVRKEAFLAPQHARRIRDSQADADALPLSGSNHHILQAKATAQTLARMGEGMEIWTVTTGAMLLSGYIPGDFIIVDRDSSETCKSGDTVLAEIRHRNSSGFKTALRRYQAPVLVADSTDPEHREINVVDTVNTVIRGKVIASWRR
ncbi:MAG: helix-turn-helix transcriptional regulator [Rhodobacteraceae bacterium]|nr:helix-turn-helix transcriptional regulator [Paracoccaceae bacterium]MBR9819703.1 helix-turn-helix transcriptional regulator [Paracoccaceae bacterium]